MVLSKLLVQPLLVARHSTIRIPEYLVEGFGRPALAFSIFLIFAWFSKPLFNVENASNFVLKCIWDASLFAAIAYWAGLQSHDRQRFMSRLFAVRSAAA
jgi:hypothetical protein